MSLSKEKYHSKHSNERNTHSPSQAVRKINSGYISKQGCDSHTNQTSENVYETGAFPAGKKEELAGGNKEISDIITACYVVEEEYSISLSKYMVMPKDDLLEQVLKTHHLSNSMLKLVFEESVDEAIFNHFVNYISISIADLLYEDDETFLLLNRFRNYDYSVYSHSFHVCVLGTALLRELEPGVSFETVKRFANGLLLHDIGKREIPKEILNKRRALNFEEWAQIKCHPKKGYDYVKNFTTIQEESLDIILHHHEAMDGSGYPHGLPGNEISIMARICKIADIYDALTSDRSYKDRLNAFYALNLMTHEMRNLVDQRILKQLIVYLDKMSKMNIRRNHTNKLSRLSIRHEL